MRIFRAEDCHRGRRYHFVVVETGSGREVVRFALRAKNADEAIRIAGERLPQILREVGGDG